MKLLQQIDWRLLVFCAFAGVAVIQLFYYWGFFRHLAFFTPRVKEQSQQHPVSVIVCARDQAANLTDKLPGVLVQTYPTTHEVIVVNDNSVDETKSLLDELKKSGWYQKTAQAFAVLLPVQSVGVMGDGRTYENVIAVRAVQTEDFMTADWAHLPYELLAKISTRIINQVKGVNRVVYDISSKPPATIEWE